jgi:general secretion pathway protein E
VTGPTGSGKTTTLYAALQRLDASQQQHHDGGRPDRIRTGRRRPDAGQRQDRPDFAKALRAILRQDPDVIMIGEIRDFRDRADRHPGLAHRPPGAGHLHTNDAASAVTRLTDMGVEPFLLSSSLLGVLAQRLVRKLCTACHCGMARAASECGQTGYQGRTGVFELLVTDDAIRAQIHNRASEADIRAAALANGMVLMRDDGERLVQERASPRAKS